MPKKNLCVLAEPHEKVLGENTLADLFAEIPGHIYAKDRNGVYIACNNFNAHDGMPSKTFLGKTDSDLPWKDKADAIRRNDKEVMEIGKGKVFIEQGKLQDGRNATAISYKAPLRDEENNIIGMIGNTIELTDDLVEKIREKVTSDKSKSRK